MGSSETRRVRLRIMEQPGAGILFETDEAEDEFPVRILSSEGAARSWAEEHYDDLLEGEDGFLFGLREGWTPEREMPGQIRAGEPRPVTYLSEEGDFRARLPELVADDDGLAITQIFEEYHPGGDRFEPFESVLWRSGR